MNCNQRAVLIVTQAIRGTASNVAKKRVELVCDAQEGHDGPHRDTRHGECWHSSTRAITTILRHDPIEPEAELRE